MLEIYWYENRVKSLYRGSIHKKCQAIRSKGSKNILTFLWVRRFWKLKLKWKKSAAIKWYKVQCTAVHNFQTTVIYYSPSPQNWAYWNHFPVFCFDSCQTAIPNFRSWTTLQGITQTRLKRPKINFCRELTTSRWSKRWMTDYHSSCTCNTNLTQILINSSNYPRWRSF